jgi:peptide subunit release factor 1 (eRF1)
VITAETVSSIRTFDGGGLPVVSLYARVDPGPGGQREVRTRVSSLLDGIRPLAKGGIAEREWRMSLRGDIDRIKSAVGRERWLPAAIAIFACSGRNLYTEVPLPENVPDRVIVDATPYARPMLAVLAEHPRSCVAVVDRATGRFCELYQDEMSELGRVEDPESRRPAIVAGRPDDRVSNKIDELAKRHYRHIAERLGELLQTGDYDLLIIGGHGYEVPDFVQQLSRPVRDRVAGTFSTKPGLVPLTEIRESAGAIAARYEQERDQQLVSGVLEKVAMGGLATVGLDRCLWAGTVGAIQTLLVRGGAAAPGVVCDQSRWLARSGEVCPLCGNPTRPTPDVIDELAQVVISEGGAIHHINSGGARLVDHDIGADLRFRLPERPAVGSDYGR